MNETTRTLVYIGLAVAVYLLYKQFLEDASSKMDAFHKKSLDMMLDLYNNQPKSEDK